MLRIIVLIPLPRERKPKHSKKKIKTSLAPPQTQSLSAGYLLTGLWYTRSNEVPGTGYLSTSTQYTPLPCFVTR